MLTNPAARAHLIEQLAAYAERQRFAGVSIDFENIPVKAQPHFQSFIAELCAVFHPKNLRVSVNVPVNDPAFGYRNLARNADALILMALRRALVDRHRRPDRQPALVCSDAEPAPTRRPRREDDCCAGQLRL